MRRRCGNAACEPNQKARCTGSRSCQRIQKVKHGALLPYVTAARRTTIFRSADHGPSGSVGHERRRPEESVPSVSLPFLLRHLVDDRHIRTRQNLVLTFEVAIQRRFIHVHLRGNGFNGRVTRAALDHQTNGRYGNRVTSDFGAASLQAILCKCLLI